MFWCQTVQQAEEEKEKVDVDQNEKREKIADGSDEKDNSLREMMLATAREAQQLAKTKTSDKREELCKLSGALAVLASASVSCSLALTWPIHHLRFLLHLIVSLL